MGFVGAFDTSDRVATQPRILNSQGLTPITRPAGQMVVLGQCLVSDDVLAAGFDSLLRDGDPRAVSQWPGCYSVVVLYPDSVTILADPVGQFPVFLAQQDNRVLFGTRAVDLASAPDDSSVVVSLVCPDSWDLTGQRTVFAGVRPVSEGAIVRITRGGVTERPFAQLRPDPTASFDQAAAALRLSLTEAVRARVSSALTSDFSGGLDSTSIAFLAARDVPRLPVLTYANPDHPVSDDVERARAYAQLAGMNHHIVATSVDQLPYQDLLAADDEPHSVFVASGPLQPLFTRAAELGAGVHLVGEGGDVVLGAPPAYLADVARRGRLAELWRHCVAWARLRNRSPLKLFWRAVELAVTSRRRALLDLASSVRQDCWEANTIAYWGVPQLHWLTGRARRLLAERASAAADEVSGMDAGDAVTLGRLRLQSRTQRAIRTIGAESGIDVHAPFLDTAVARACLTLSARRRVDPSIAKPLLRKALAGLVPDMVLARSTKGDYIRDAYQGVRRAAPALRQLLAEPVAADLGLIEPGPIRAAVADAVRGLAIPWQAFNQVLAVETWLRKVMA